MSSLARIISRRATNRGSSPADQHPGQVVQRGVDVGAADRLDERADHVVVLIAVAVITHGGLVQRLLDGRDRHLLAAAPGFRRHLQRRQRAPRIARRELHQQFDGVLGDINLASETARIVDGPAHHGLHRGGVERLQLQDQRPRQQRSNDGERRVFRGGRDQQHDPVLDGREQCVLLGLGESVHLVDEQHGLLTVRGGPAREIYDGADLLDARRQRRQRLEPAAGCLRDQRRQRRLARAGRAVEDHRRRA